MQITTQGFWIQAGLRTRERQAALVARGASRTMNSGHLTGHAVDPVRWTARSAGSERITSGRSHHQAAAHELRHQCAGAAAKKSQCV